MSEVHNHQIRPGLELIVAKNEEDLFTVTIRENGKPIACRFNRTENDMKSNAVRSRLAAGLGHIAADHLEHGEKELQLQIGSTLRKAICDIFSGLEVVDREWNDTLLNLLVDTRRILSVHPDNGESMLFLEMDAPDESPIEETAIFKLPHFNVIIYEQGSFETSYREKFQKTVSLTKEEWEMLVDFWIEFWNGYVLNGSVYENSSEIGSPMG